MTCPHSETGKRVVCRLASAISEIGEKKLSGVLPSQLMQKGRSVASLSTLTHDHSCGDSEGGTTDYHVYVGGGGSFFLACGIFRECSTAHSLPTLFFLFFLKWRLARAN